MKRPLPILAALLAGATCLLAAAPATAPSDYRLLKKIIIGGEGRWDYVTVDSPTHRLFVPRSTHVAVLDLSTDELRQVGDVIATPGVHGVAIDPKSGRGFASNGSDNSVSVFDLKTTKLLGHIPTGQGPDAIVLDPATGQILTMNHKSGDITAFKADADLSQPAATTTIPVGGTLEFAVVDGAGHLYVNVEDKNEVVAVDTRAMTVTAHWTLGEGQEPTGLAIDVANGLLFSACHNEKLIVLDAGLGTVVATLPIGKNVDGCAFDAERALAFTSNGDGTLTVVSDRDPRHPAVVATVPTQLGARTLALDPSTHRLYLPTADLQPAVNAARPQVLPNTFTILIVGDPL